MIFHIFSLLLCKLPYASCISKIPCYNETINIKIARCDMSKQISVVLVGAGNRANVYAKLALEEPEKMKVVGVVDPDPVRVKAAVEMYGIPAENCFSSVEEFVARDKFADAVINGTMDDIHVVTSIPVLKKGYDMLLEKPFAVNEDELNCTWSHWRCKTAVLDSECNLHLAACCWSRVVCVSE